MWRTLMLFFIDQAIYGRKATANEANSHLSNTEYVVKALVDLLR
jgi:hypothetical protein